MSEQNIHAPVGGHIIGGNLTIYGSDSDPDVIPWSQATVAQLRQQIRWAKSKERVAMLRGFFNVYILLGLLALTALGVMGLKFILSGLASPPIWMLALAGFLVLGLLYSVHNVSETRKAQINLINYVREVRGRAQLELDLRR